MNDKNSEKNISWETIESVQRMQDFIEEHALDVNSVQILCMILPVIPKDIAKGFSEN